MSSFLLELLIEPLEYEFIESAEEEIELAFRKFIEIKDIHFCEIKIIVRQTRIVIFGTLESNDMTKEEMEEYIPIFLRGIESKNQMRWGTGSMTFYRPISNILFLLDNKVLKLEIEGIKSSNKTYIDYIHELTINSPEEYFERMDKYIGFDEKASISKLKSSANKAAASAGKALDTSNIKFDKIFRNIENPEILTAEFEDKLLEVPDSIIEAVLAKHGNVIPLFNDGELSNAFLTVVKKGSNHKRVLEDLVFVINSELRNIAQMFTEDEELSLSEYVPRLNWFNKYQNMGNLYDKTVRLEKIVSKVADLLSLSEDMKADLNFCSHIMKADLATRIVRRYKSLRGIVGSEMLRESGSSERICQAIAEQYLPDEHNHYPNSTIGYILSICDKLDDVVGLMIIDSYLVNGGEYIKSKIDNIIKLLVNSNLKLSIYDLIDTTLYVYADESIGAFDYNKIYNNLSDYFKLRVKNELRNLKAKTILTSEEIIDSRKDYSSLFNTILSLSDKLDDVDEGLLNQIINIRKLLTTKEITDADKYDEEIRFEEIIDHISDKCDDPIEFMDEIKKYRKDIDALYETYLQHEYITNYSKNLQEHLKDRWI